jgi:hypothetical protein
MYHSTEIDCSLNDDGIILTAATLPEAEMAPSVRLDCWRALLNMVTTVDGLRER